MNKKLDQLRPKMVDSACDARDYSENQLIALRDEMIQNKIKEVVLLPICVLYNCVLCPHFLLFEQLSMVTERGEKLEVQLDRTEMELQKMQQDLVEKDIALNKYQNEIVKLKREVSRLTQFQKEETGGSTT